MRGKLTATKLGRNAFLLSYRPLPDEWETNPRPRACTRALPCSSTGICRQVSAHLLAYQTDKFCDERCNMVDVLPSAFGPNRRERATTIREISHEQSISRVAHGRIRTARSHETASSSVARPSHVIPQAFARLNFFLFKFLWLKFWLSSWAP